MKEIYSITRDIKALCSISAVFAILGLGMENMNVIENGITPSSLLFICGTIYILVQIEKASKILLENPFFPISLKLRFIKVAVCCIIMGFGASIIDTIYLSIKADRLYICLNLTTIGIGVLLLVGAYIYGYGCEMQEENDFTV